MNTATAMRLQIIAEHNHTRITDGALSYPLHKIMAHENNRPVCSISNPEQLDGVQIEIAAQNILNTEQERLPRNAVLQIEDGAYILYLDLQFCRFIRPASESEASP